MVKLYSRPFSINVIQVYAPTQDHSNAEIEVFYEGIEKALKYAKSDDILCVMGDLNAKVGSEPFESKVVKYRLEEKNDRGERLIEICQQNNLKIANTLFQHTNCRLYTWKRPGNIVRNQIDYIMVNQRFRNSIKSGKTFPEADIYSDNNPVFNKMQVMLKKSKSCTQTTAIRCEYAKARSMQSQMQYCSWK